VLQLETAIEIDASPEAVWAVLTDFSRFPEWNPFVRSASGEARVGSRLRVFLQPVGGKGMEIRPTVLVAAPGRELRWLGHLFVPGIFDGEHFFRIEPGGPGRVRFVQGERFGGVLIPFFRKMLIGGTRQGFELMNRALKARVEGMREAGA
jgi:hypothetical protein